MEHSSILETKRHTIVSCATGISMNEINDVISKDVGIYRIMPNTAASVNESITAIASNGDPLNREEVVFDLLGSLGDTVKKGDLMAIIHNTERTAMPPVEYYAKYSGIVIARHVPSLAKMGDCLYVIADIVGKP